MNSPAGSSQRRSPIPARLDLTQSLTGLALALFMWTHLILVSSILLGKDSMQTVTDIMEAEFLRSGDHGYPVIVSVIGIVIAALFILHAGIALRKFPSSWAQHRELRDQMKILNHSDTRYWYLQAVTGFVMFFLGSVHIYIMTTQPDTIGPFGSSDRVWTDLLWPLYLVLLFAVELHATVGMYRLAVKWGILDGKNPVATRKRLKLAKNVMTVFFLALGLATLATYMKIGYDHRDEAGEPYKVESHESPIQQSVAQRGDGR